MSDTDRATANIRIMEELADKDTAVHRRHPVANLLVTLFYIVAVASYGKYELSALLPLLFYPLAVFSIADIPPGLVLKRMALALPFVIGIGIFNPIFDKNTITLAGMAISAGWVSFASILLRCCLSVVGALLLMCVEGMKGLSAALRALKVPRILVMQLLLTFRYIHVLGEEAARMMLAYQLRAPGQRGIAFRQWGPMAGQWLLRTLKRADRLHQAMLCRGFNGDLPARKPGAFTLTDTLYLLGWTALFVAARLVNIPQAIGSLFS